MQLGCRLRYPISCHLLENICRWLVIIQKVLFSITATLNDGYTLDFVDIHNFSSMDVIYVKLFDYVLIYSISWCTLVYSYFTIIMQLHKIQIFANSALCTRATQFSSCILPVLQKFKLPYRSSMAMCIWSSYQLYPFTFAVIFSYICMQHQHAITGIYMYTFVYEIANTGECTNNRVEGIVRFSYCPYNSSYVFSIQNFLKFFCTVSLLHSYQLYSLNFMHYNILNTTLKLILKMIQ